MATTAQKDVGCFGCAFWIAVFIAFCMVLFFGLQWLWHWGQGVI